MFTVGWTDVYTYLYGRGRVQADGVVTGFAGQMCREATHALQAAPDVGQEGAQRPLEVEPRASLHGLQADAAQRVAAQDGG